jgi:hypothetical protein
LDWYGPNDAWPRHSRDYFRVALTYARESGWWFAEYESHSFGKVVCDKSLPKDSRCEFLVFSTGSGSESSALELRSRVDRCPHRGEASKSAVEIARELLDGADILMEAAQVCMAAEDRRARGYELLSMAYEQAGAAERAMEQAFELDSLADNDLASARDLADSAGYPSQADVEPEPLLDVAEARTSLASQKVTPSGKSQARERVQRRAAATQARIQALREQFIGQ